MSPIDGPIGLVPETNLAFTTDVNISKAQLSKAKGLGGDSGQRSKSPTILYKYRYRQEQKIISVTRQARALHFKRGISKGKMSYFKTFLGSQLFYRPFWGHSSH